MFDGSFYERRGVEGSGKLKHLPHGGGMIMHLGKWQETSRRRRIFEFEGGRQRMK